MQNIGRGLFFFSCYVDFIIIQNEGVRGGGIGTSNADISYISFYFCRLLFTKMVFVSSHFLHFPSLGNSIPILLH